MKREPKYYCIKSFSPNESNEIFFTKDKWYNSADFYDYDPNNNLIAMCLENETNQGMVFTTINNNHEFFLYEYFATPNMMRKLKLQKLNSL